MTRKLTLRQRRFVDEYAVDLSATKAARRAGYSANTARSQGQRLSTNVDIHQAIKKAAEERAQRTDITADKVVQELAMIAFQDASDVVAWGPDGVRLLDSGDLDEDVRRAVAEVSQTVTKDGGTIRVKLHDKVKALELLGKHLGLMVGRKEVTVTPGGDRPFREWPLEDLVRVRDYLRAQPMEGEYRVVGPDPELDSEPEALPLRE